MHLAGLSTLATCACCTTIPADPPSRAVDLFLSVRPFMPLEPTAPARKVVDGRNFMITLRAKLSGAVYCYRSCLWPAGGRVACVCGCVCGSVTTITRNCMQRSSQTGFVGKGSDHLQLIKFWPSRAPRKGVCGGAKIFGSASAVFASPLSVFFSFFLFVSFGSPTSRTGG